MPDAMACLAASAAIAVSDIPFNGPISEVRVARVNGEFVVNPTVEQMADADIDLMVAATQDSVVMVEGEMKEVSEAEMLEAIKVGHEEIKKQCQLQLDLASKVDKANPKREYSHEDSDEELYKAIDAFCYDKCREIALEGIADKQVRKEKFAAIKEAFIATLPEEEAQEKSYLIGQFP